MTASPLQDRVSAVVVDYKALFVRSATPELQGRIRHMLEYFQSQGLRVVVLSTDPFDLAALCRDWGYPALLDHISLRDIRSGKKRGSPDWVDAVTSRLTVARHRLMYVGVTAMDWRTAINSGVFYLHAGWAAPQPGKTTCLVADLPLDICTFLYHFLLRGSRWSYHLDSKQHGLQIRSLLPASAWLPSTTPTNKATLQDVFTYERDIQVGDASARSILMLHVLSSFYNEGLLARNSYFCVYPSSKVGQVNNQIEEYIRPASSLVHGYYKDDLLVRHREAPDTSLARVRARREGRTADISILTQSQSVSLGEKYRGKLADRSVIVFDDFTTSGMSLEWARNLLLAGGAANVTMVTIGKYKSTHDTYRVKVPIDPFSQNSLRLEDFEVETLTMAYNGAVAPELQGLFSEWISLTQTP